MSTKSLKKVSKNSNKEVDKTRINAAAMLVTMLSTERAPTILPEGSPDYRSRGMNAIQRSMDDGFDGAINRLDSNLRGCTNQPLLKKRVETVREQYRRFRANIVPVCWDIAENWLKENRFEAIRWLSGDDRDSHQLAAESYLNSVLREQLNVTFNPNKTLCKVVLNQTQVDHYRERAINVAGGVDHFLICVLALSLTTPIQSAFEIIRVGSKSLILNDPVIRRILKGTESLWVEDYALKIAFLLSLTTEQVVEYSSIVFETRSEVIAEFDELGLLYEEESAINSKTIAEVSALRKRVDRAEVLNKSQRQEINKLQGELAAVNRKQVPAPTSSDVTGLLTVAHDELRKLQKQCAFATEQAEDATAELASMKEFLSVVMKPEDTKKVPETKPFSSPTDWKVIFVGGHERLHSKLRKVMPNATFLHPDSIKFDARSFKQADVVVFCVGYCNHTLSTAAANEVRRVGIPSGFTSSTNVEKVLEDIRGIFH